MFVCANQREIGPNFIYAHTHTHTTSGMGSCCNDAAALRCLLLLLDDRERERERERELSLYCERLLVDFFALSVSATCERLLRVRQSWPMEFSASSFCVARAWLLWFSSFGSSTTQNDDAIVEKMPPASSRKLVGARFVRCE